jgi:hypothetical protein
MTATYPLLTVPNAKRQYRCCPIYTPDVHVKDSQQGLTRFNKLTVKCQRRELVYTKCRMPTKEVSAAVLRKRVSCLPGDNL